MISTGQTREPNGPVMKVKARYVLKRPVPGVSFSNREIAAEIETVVVATTPAELAEELGRLHEVLEREVHGQFDALNAQGDPSNDPELAARGFSG